MSHSYSLDSSIKQFTDEILARGIFPPNIEAMKIKRKSELIQLPLIKLGQLCQKMQRECYLPEASSKEIIRNFIVGFEQIRSEDVCDEQFTRN